jgi:hypothetical protein
MSRKEPSLRIPLALTVVVVAAAGACGSQDLCNNVSHAGGAGGAGTGGSNTGGASSVSSVPSPGSLGGPCNSAGDCAAGLVCQCQPDCEPPGPRCGICEPSGSNAGSGCGAPIA